MSFHDIELFDKFPEDIKNNIYNRILYPQPEELLKEIRSRGRIYNILCILKREKDLKPTLENIAVAVCDLPSKRRNAIMSMMEKMINPS
jgi:hypothetical protein